MGSTVVTRSPARRPATRATDTQVERTFSYSILLSAFRCLLSYVILPVVTPVLGAATNLAPALGIPVAAVALVFDAYGIRRFWLVRHRWRWPVTVIYVAVMGLVASLLVTDIRHFV